MIDDMASLKQAMEQMDAQDPVVAQAAKDRAGQLLSDAQLSFLKMAELIEQRRLLLRPRIVASIKRMDQPAMLGEAAFRDAGTALRREGQSFRQIAEAIELNGSPAPQYQPPTPNSEPFYDLAGESEPPAWLLAANVVMRIVFFPLRHPMRFLAVALLAVLLFNVLRGATVGQQISGFVDRVASVRQRTDAAKTWVSSFFGKPTSPQSEEAAAPPTPPAPIPSPPAASPSPSSVPPSSAATSAWIPPATAPTPPANESAPAAASPAMPAGPSASTPRPDARVAPPKSAANDRPLMVRPRSLLDLTPARLRRNSRSAGPCIGGVGGCYWGGGQY